MPPFLVKSLTAQTAVELMEEISLDVVRLFLEHSARDQNLVHLARANTDMLFYASLEIKPLPLAPYLTAALSISLQSSARFEYSFAEFLIHLNSNCPPNSLCADSMIFFAVTRHDIARPW